MAKLWLLLLLCSALSLSRSSSEPPPGHLLPLGSHREPRQVARTTASLTSEEFYSQYVDRERPVIFEGLLNSTQLLQTWGDDQYLRERFGEDEVGVEHKKKENRSETGFITTMADYLERYRREDIYMVSALSPAMQEEWLLPNFLLCGGFTDNLIFSYIWFSSGGTISVLHTDAFDNLHCLVSGVKEFLLIEPQYIDTIGSEHKTQGYFNIDVDQVDMLSHPGLVSVPWFQAVVWPGDCLYIPHLWVHHVRSHDRNLGVNIWWSAFQYNPVECVDVPQFAPLSQYTLVPDLQLKQGLLDLADSNGVILATDVHKTLAMRPDFAGLQLETVINEIFEALKPGCQGQLLTSDLHSLPTDVFVSVFHSFLSAVHPGEGDQGWADEGGEWGEGGWEGEWGYSEVGDMEEGEMEGGGDFPQDHNHDEL